MQLGRPYSQYSFGFSVYDALSVIKFCILTERIDGGYYRLACLDFLNQLGTGEGCKYLVINHRFHLIYMVSKLNQFMGSKFL